MTQTKLKYYPNLAQSLGINGIVILTLLLLSPVTSVFNKLVGKEASMLIYQLLAMGIPFWIVYSIRKNKTDHQPFNLIIENNRIVLFIIVGSIALMLGVVTPITSLIPIPASLTETFIELSNQTGVFVFAHLIIAAPILEELIFRGIMLDGLLKQYSPTKSILISSLLFGLMHLNPWQFIPGLIIGFFSGWVYYRTQSLSPSIIIHAAANLFAYFIRVTIDADSSIEYSLVEMFGGMTNLIIMLFGSIIVVSICIYSLKKEFNRPLA